MSFYKYIILITIIIPMVLGLLYIIDEASTTTHETEKYELLKIAEQTEQKQISIFEELNTMKDPIIKANTEELISSPTSKVINGFIIIVTTLISFLWFKQFEKSYGVILFGMYLCFAHSLIYNLICFYVSSQWCFQFAIENLFSTFGIGIFSAIIIVVFNYVKGILKILPEYDVSLMEWFGMKFKYNFMQYNLATLQNWLIIGIATAGMIIILNQ